MGDKKVIALGVTGGIAAYKSAELCSSLVKNNFEVQVVMTKNAQMLVSEATFYTLSQRPVVTSLWEVPDWRPGHVALADEADLLVIVPCTANMIGKVANGIADDSLSTLALSVDCPIIIAPAMNPKMWKNAAVQHNIEVLKSRGVELIGPATGRVACGDPGTGRMVEASEILENIIKKFNS